ncbi:MAG: HAMP domain-containing sensor histidine kinase, partial [Acidobacteriota bacterium]
CGLRNPRLPDRLEPRTLKSRGQANIPITILIILLKGAPEQLSLFDAEDLTRRLRRTIAPYPLSFRIRVWDRNYLTSLVQQFPQIGFKYFSEEGRSRSRYRKTPEELYRENIDLAARLAKTVAALEDEKNRRVRAERDAVWKDISFSAAHKIGNPIFAIETNLGPLQKRVQEERIEEALDVMASIRVSVEKAKGIVEQFKSLTRAQEIRPLPALLRPILEDACRTAEMQGVRCQIECPPDIGVNADPDRLAECFDELVSNALHWLDKADREITVQVTQPEATSLPSSADSSKRYALVHFKDNGPGVAPENKSKIFDAFFTTQSHGTGLGLALVRRIIEGHGGTIIETGLPEQGTDFEVYLPLVANGPRAAMSSAEAANEGQRN